MAALNQVGEQWLVHGPSDLHSDPPGNRPVTLYGSRSR
jgi:hypothetical protein